MHRFDLSGHSVFLALVVLALLTVCWTLVVAAALSVTPPGRSLPRWMATHPLAGMYPSDSSVHDGSVQEHESTRRLVLFAAVSLYSAIFAATMVVL